MTGHESLVPTTEERPVVWISGVHGDRRTHVSRYRLDVVAASAADAVEHAGGWLFDRALAGWDVTVLVVNDSDTRPLRILGATMLALEPVLEARGDGRLPQALAVAGDLCGRDPRTRSGVLRALQHGAIEVVVWGEDWPPGDRHAVNPVRHRLSTAAQLFKAQALDAASITSRGVDSTEVFRSGCTADSSVLTDLDPVL